MSDCCGLCKTVSEETVTLGLNSFDGILCIIFVIDKFLNDLTMFNAGSMSLDMSLDIKKICRVNTLQVFLMIKIRFWFH